MSVHIYILFFKYYLITNSKQEFYIRYIFLQNVLRLFFFMSELYRYFYYWLQAHLVSVLKNKSSLHSSFIVVILSLLL